jgi:hypothetical protein
MGKEVARAAAEAPVASSSAELGSADEAGGPDGGRPTPQPRAAPRRQGADPVFAGDLEVRQELAKLVSVFRGQVLGMTTVTANDLVTEEKLRFIARERNHVEQRRAYERLKAEGARRLARAGCRRPGGRAPSISSEFCRASPS